MSDNERKIERAIALLRAIPQDTDIELAYSTGKDSDVILQLAKEAGIPFRAIYKNTTIDRVGSLKHAKEMGVEIIQPQKTFFELIQSDGCPTRFSRFCCRYLKEYKTEGCDRSIMGVRRAESAKRAKRYHEPEECRKYRSGGKVIAYYPILDWTDADVERFIKERGLKCHPWYYDSDGKFHIERRVGCMGCPLSNKKRRIQDFLLYPKLLKLWISNFQIYLNTHPTVKIHELCQSNPYNKMFYDLFCDNNNEYQNFMGGGIFGSELAIDAKAYLEDYFGIDLTI